MPKGAICSFIVYRCEQWKLIQQENSTISLCEASKLIGLQWTKLDAEERAPYEKLAAEDKERHNRQLCELHQLGYFTLLDGSKSTDAINRPVLKKR